ncbi:MAG: 4Fe-4S binding protein [Nitrososphaerota archaeon]|uniref:ATP-binding protein n=1 Tax=Candidatus Bathycorpusculum sp. TaxID=2994959 RepID=UPI0028332855|nr:4Fe-4S binding protein [Candidatus Termitimicrobium sp.]MCL2431929.1 4Fe-4S binding protein [Candidatus Termitimicrobium sp.]MDR0493419.1 4Fe-4S binding protein [Nitrososphaerota archaeon]
MKRKIIQINHDLCNGCGACIPKCAEGALQVLNGKAQLVKDTYCDGLGACLGECPQNAITITEREADAFDEKEVHNYLKNKNTQTPQTPTNAPDQKPQWPIKLDLVSPNAPFFENAALLLAADCAPVALKNFHDLMTNKRIIIGCPKFNDARAYAEKLTNILTQNNLTSIMVVHMEVPCCTGLKWALNKAIEKSGKHVPIKELEVKIGGGIVEL